MFDFDEEPMDLSTLISYAEKAQELQSVAEELSAELKAVNAELEEYLSKKIPAAMSAVGMKKFTLSDGTNISLKDVIAGSIDKAPNKNFAYQWTIDNGGEELIKTNVSIDFGKSEHNYASAFIADCREKDLDPTVKETIHPQTFCSFLRDKKAERDKALESGDYVEEIPFKDLGVYVGQKAVFK